VKKAFERRRVVLIGCASLLMLALVMVVGMSLQSAADEAVLAGPAERERESIPVEAGVFARSSLGLLYKERENVEGTRTLTQYYSRRAYPGGPPVIPHEIFDEQGFGGKGCLSCHANGDYVPKLKAYAPVVPHPELTSCKQCHVAGERKDGSLFAQSDFRPLEPTPIHQPALPGGPAPIPHTLEMRNNCLACHGGPSAPKEIRTTHPERSNCRQCHVTSQGIEEQFSE
jgi:cytochrome c-type protein NapB